MTEPSTPAEPRDLLPFGHHHAFLIGINAYTKVSPLQTPADDARQLAAVLARQQHFTVHPPLIDATGAEVRELLHSTLPATVGKDDRVFFYFAGHGIAADGDEGPAGYIAAADADPTDVTTLIPMADLQAALDSLPCRHLLLVLDCCFSGAFKWSSHYRAIGTMMPKTIYKERFDRFIQEPAWQVITSAAYDQQALDVLQGKATGARGLSASDQQTPHSPFAQALFEGLSGKADATTDATGEGDGVITATELYSYIRDCVEPATIEASQGRRQTPGFFPLRKHDKGEFIFLKPNHRLNLPPIPSRSPYKGLESFNESDRELFYGRERVVAELRARAERSKLLVVSGASGTGKSSVIKAGLLPVLRKEGFRILPVVRPGAHPLPVLEAALAEAHAPAPNSGTGTVTPSPQAILIVDQFEELITRCADPNERRQFDARLRRVLDEDSSIYRIILTVRSDFEPQLNGGELQPYWIPGRCTVPPFSLEELKEIVVMPTLQEVLIFDPPDLVDEIVAEVVQSPGALPLLSYALSELYEMYRTGGRQDRALKKADYDKLGGVMGALRNKADSLYQSLDAPERDTMRRIMLRMVAVEGELAGKRVPVEDLVFSHADKPRVSAVVERLVEARLIVKGQDYIEPAHDALVRAWRTLHDWVFEVGKDKLILGAKLNAAASDFARSNNKEFLWSRNPNLAVVEKDFDEFSEWFNERESAFVRKSVARRKRQARTWWSAAATIAVALLLLTGWALVERGTAQEQSAVARAQTVVATEKTTELESRQRTETQLNDMASRALDGVLEAEAAPGVIKVQSPDNAWRSLMQTQPFAMYLEHGKGRIIAVAHDGILSDRGTPDAYNLLQGALNWLTDEDHSKTLLVSSGHCEVVGMTPPFRMPLEQFDRWGHSRIEPITDLTTLAQRAADSVLVVGNIWGDDLRDDEIRAVERYVSDGGGLFAAGLGWSWLTYSNSQGPTEFNPCTWEPNSAGLRRATGRSMDRYPMNRLLEPFGLEWEDREIVK